MSFSARQLAASLLLLCSPLATADTVIEVASYGAIPNSGGDATVPFQQAIAAARTAPKPVTLRIAAGRYDFFSTNATHKACFYSNATESGSGGMRTIAIDLSDCDQLTVEGNGATLMMRGRMTMLVAERCEDLAIRNLTFDFARPTFSEITAVEKQSTYWIGRVHPDSNYTISGNRILWSGEDWSGFHDLTQHYDPSTQTVWRGSDPTSGATSVTDLGNRLVRFNVPSGSLGLVSVGRTFQFRNAYRNECGMWFNRSRDVLIKDVNVRAMHGFGILSQFTEDVTFERLEVAPDPDSGRTCASPADILHFANCKGTVRILDSKLTAAHDDAMNVHGTHLRVMTQPAARQFKLRFMHGQSWGFQAYVPGDEIEFVRKDSLLPFGSAIVTAVEMTSDPYEQLVTIDRDPPVGIILNSDAVENVTWTPAVEMINCDIAQIPTRGILLTTRRPIVIQGNRFFRTQMHGILIEDDAAGWYESGPVHNLIVRGNSFFECAERVIHINPENTTHGGPVHKNITLTDNVFTLTGTGAADAKSTDNLSITGNLFRMRNGSSPAASTLVSTTNTTNLSVTGNTVVPATTPALAVTDGGFEQQSAGPWFPTSSTGIRYIASGDSAGILAELDSNTAIYQKLGTYDPIQGTSLRWSIDQRAINGNGGPVTVSFHVWDGRFVGAAGADVGSLPAFATRTLSSWQGSTLQLSGYVDLSSLPAGSQIWMRVAAGGSTVRLDAASVTTGAPPDTSKYGGWAAFAGLGGSDSAPQADPDHDGIPNLLEYLLNDTSPLRPDGSAVQSLLKAEDGLPMYRYHPRAVTDAVLVAEYQKNSLSNGWLPVQNGIDGLALHEDPDGVKWVEVVDTLADKLFIRLRAAPTPVPPPVVINGSFETPDRTGQSTAYSNGNPDGWTFTSGVNWGVEEIRDNRFGTSGVEGSRLNSLGGDADQIGYINIGSSGSGSATSSTIGTIAPDTTYKLTVRFGQRASGDRHPDGSFGLATNGTALGTFTSITSTTLSTGFTEKTYTWTSPAFGDPLIGQPLQIRMNFNHSPASGWQQAQFDKVQLTVE